MAKLLVQLCKANKKLNKSHVEARKNGSAIDRVIILVNIKTRLQQITYLSFKDDLRFLTAGSSVIEIKKVLEKAEKITLDWGTYNAVIYNISKTETILFFKA